MSSGGFGTSGVDTWDVDKWNAHLQRAFPETRFPILEMMIQSFSYLYSGRINSL